MFKKKAVVVLVEGIDNFEDEYQVFRDRLDWIVSKGRIQILVSKDRSEMEGGSLLNSIMRNSNEAEDDLEESQTQNASILLRDWENIPEMFSSSTFFLTTDPDLEGVNLIEDLEDFADYRREFLENDGWKLMFVYCDVRKEVKGDICELFGDGSEEDFLQYNFIFSKIGNCEKSDFFPEIGEIGTEGSLHSDSLITEDKKEENSSILSSIIPKQTFTTYMNKKVSVDYTSCSLLIQYEKDITRRQRRLPNEFSEAKSGEFETLQDVVDYIKGRHSTRSVFMGKTFLSDNFIMEVAFKLGIVGKFGA
ncbi:unnamed protein product [Moneuplotes crassus]|uniref:Uncharacterized protein n=1 Tax=Euplotes crassus TaxID=5936 RepID=A0AAD1UMX7_EUPCR|nr:unnamed protein product [Moneuplotes crassus]